MRIEWNAVTWYSWLATAFFFLGVMPMVALYIRADYIRTKEEIDRPPVVLFVSAELRKDLR